MKMKRSTRNDEEPSFRPTCKLRRAAKRRRLQRYVRRLVHLPPVFLEDRSHCRTDHCRMQLTHVLDSQIPARASHQVIQRAGARPEGFQHESPDELASSAARISVGHSCSVTAWNLLAFLAGKARCSDRAKPPLQAQAVNASKTQMLHSRTQLPARGSARQCSQKRWYS